MTCRTKRTADDNYPDPRWAAEVIRVGRRCGMTTGNAFLASLEQEIDRAYTQMAKELSSPLPLNLTPIKRSRWRLAKNRVRWWLIDARERIARWIAPWLRYREDD